MSFSNFIIYVDESGDHSLTSNDENYPVFVLSFCIFEKAQYSAQASRDLQDFKFRWFGHDSFVLHESDIVKRRFPFGFLQFDDIRERFLNDFSAVLEMTPMTVIAAVIRSGGTPIQKTHISSHCFSAWKKPTSFYVFTMTEANVT